MHSLQSVIQEVKSRFLADLTALVPELRPAAESLLQIIGAPNWTLEWGLPCWLGTTFGLPADAIPELIAFNAFGLGFVRLADHLADGESPWSDPVLAASAQTPRPAAANNGQGRLSWKQAPRARLPTHNEAVLLQVSLHHLSTLQIRRLADRIQARQGIRTDEADPADSLARAFFRWSDAYMRQWLRATLDRHEQPLACFRACTNADFLRLAERGAPLKTCCAAACALSDRLGDLDTVTSAVDDLLVGCVLLDHLDDWAQDIEADRYNAFVAYCSDLPQCHENRNANRDAVLIQLYWGDGGRPYLILVQKYVGYAMTHAASIGCEGLAEFITELGNEISTYGIRFAAQLNQQRRTIIGILEDQARLRG
jgi:hypothetical protein